MGEAASAWARLVIGRGDYHSQHEPTWCAVRKGRKGHWAGDRKQTTVWTIPHRKSASGHGTEKPVECMRRPIENNSSPGQAVYEPFSGSGTTIIAAEMRRRCARSSQKVADGCCNKFSLERGGHGPVLLHDPREGATS